jgi:branched-chain amino acid transport system substrate-binding protein
VQAIGHIQASTHLVRRRSKLACALGLAALAMVVVVVASGCGGVGVSGAAAISGNQLTVYSSLPLQGSLAPTSQQIVNGEKLALYDAGGHVGSFRVSYFSLDDANPKTGQWDPGITASNAKTAAQDTTTIGYLGDYDSAATAISLPIINGAGILQISPASQYVGLTSSLDAGQDEPERFYPTGHRNFGRLRPADPVQAAAQVRLMSTLGVKHLYVLDDQDPFQVPLAQIVAQDATTAGIHVLAHDSLDTASSAERSSEVSKVAESDAQAVFISGNTSPGLTALFQKLHAADPHLLLLGSDTTLNSASVAKLGSAGESTYLTTPLLPPGAYPASAQGVLADYQRRFHETPTANVLYGYEAMTVVLDSIRNAGSHGNDKQTVIEQFFHIRNRDSVLGRYSIQPSGDTTLSLYGVDRVVGGQLVFWRSFEGG